MHTDTPTHAHVHDTHDAYTDTHVHAPARDARERKRMRTRRARTALYTYIHALDASVHREIFLPDMWVRHFILQEISKIYYDARGSDTEDPNSPHYARVAHAERLREIIPLHEKATRKLRKMRTIGSPIHGASTRTLHPVPMMKYFHVDETGREEILVARAFDAVYPPVDRRIVTRRGMALSMIEYLYTWTEVLAHIHGEGLLRVTEKYSSDGTRTVFDPRAGEAELERAYKDGVIEEIKPAVEVHEYAEDDAPLLDGVSPGQDTSERVRILRYWNKRDLETWVEFAYFFSVMSEESYRVYSNTQASNKNRASAMLLSMWSMYKNMRKIQGSVIGETLPGLTSADEKAGTLEDSAELSRVLALVDSANNRRVSANTRSHEIVAVPVVNDGVTQLLPLLKPSSRKKAVIAT